MAAAHGLVREQLQQLSKSAEQSDTPAFYVVDLDDIMNKYRVWKEKLPRVQPFYAVKCNPSDGVIALLAKLGTGFDCSSKSEIQLVLDQGGDPKDIIWSNPFKQMADIRFSEKHAVDMLAFDTEEELHKIKAVHPKARLIIRICPGEACDVRSRKFGCNQEDAQVLLQLARSLNLNVIGVSFHIGAESLDDTAIISAVTFARSIFEIGKQYGFHFELLDIGGGFPGKIQEEKISFEKICDDLKPALDKFFPENMGIRVIAEPGRYFVETAFTMAVRVIGKRRVQDHSTDDTGVSYMYYVSDGIYGSFREVLLENPKLGSAPIPVDTEKQIDATKHKTSLWGPTEDSLDCICKECYLPELDVGEWIMFRDMGAYTLTAMTDFCGFTKPPCYYLNGQA